ncbi:hypothetical protein [Elizabethkingia anophelis]|uniref:hypothetical protein n=1 Tax=Elizabethkingia anophelis TaxID=1117645 RepID=UPI00099A7254|nr:hypothetical protein [Elizabethkingia anophelis]MCT4286227.1 hypothetical protein [Elizabethkingia anophelis]OPC38674.1 hypothetical protein BAY02_10435 [Elizabethkingia anophelis]QRI51308.1 hypothetical protein JQC76_07415 [Elizabethkingia anophelis]
METKDIFYIVGILITLLLGLMNFKILKNNRINTLREHIYKEQFHALNEIFCTLGIINSEIDNSFNRRQLTDKFVSELDILSLKIYQFQYVLPNQFLEPLINLAQILSSENYKLNSQDFGYYTSYYDKYGELIILVREEFMIDKLHNENLKILVGKKHQTSN